MTTGAQQLNAMAREIHELRGEVSQILALLGGQGDASTDAQTASRALMDRNDRRRAGKACGDSCISKDKTCNVGPGCACNR